MGWLFLNLAQAGNAFKEDIRISAYLRTMNKDSITQIQQYIAAQPYAKNVEYVNKEKAKEIWNKDNNEDWNKILDVNPLPESIDFYARATYVNTDSLNKISGDIMRLYSNQITDLQYPSGLVNNLNERASKLGVVFLVVAAVWSSAQKKPTYLVIISTAGGEVQACGSEDRGYALTLIEALRSAPTFRGDTMHAARYDDSLDLAATLLKNEEVIVG